MSNIKEIDGVFVNLDLVKWIKIEGTEKEGFSINFVYNFTYQIQHDRGDDFLHKEIRTGRIKYKTEKQAENRIRQIIKTQNKEQND